MKIPIDLNEELEESRAKLGHTHTQAIEEAVRLYVRWAKRQLKVERDDAASAAEGDGQ